MLDKLLSVPEALTKPVTKLLETIAGALGKAYEPTHIRRLAKAEGDAAIIKTRAEVDIAKIRAEGAIELQKIALRASERINSNELRRQQNIESIAGKAIHQLPEAVSEEPADEDWIVQFFNYSQDVRDEEMQKIWAQLLAGEVAEPGSYSLRTLHAVKMLRRVDAELFQLFSDFLWNRNIFFHSGRDEDLQELSGMTYDLILHLGSLGLMSIGDGLHLKLPPGSTREFDYFGKQHRLSNPESGRLQKLYAYILTDIGSELATLCDSGPIEEYRSGVVKIWTEREIEVQVLESPESSSDA